MLSQHVAVDRVFHALGDPTRRAILEQLERRAGFRLAAGEAAPDHVGRWSSSTSRCSRLAAWSQTEKVGRVPHLPHRTKGFFGGGAMDQRDRRSLWERRFDRLGKLLGEPHRS